MYTKEAVCFAYATAMQPPNLEKRRVFFLTPAGIISGEFFCDDEEKPASVENKYGNLIESAYKLVEETPEGEPSDAFPGKVIYLYNVEIQCVASHEILKVPSLALFADQVVASFLTPPERTL